MINSEEFSERLQQILVFNGLTASAFADRIGVQRSSISHILSGRNKPSLDFVLKVVDEFPDVEIYWLLNGKGKFPSTPKADTPYQSGNTLPIDLASEGDNRNVNNESIERIVIFYKDGTFKNFIN